MATKQLEPIDLYQILKLVVNTWIDLIPFQNFEFSSESSTFAYTINSKEFTLATYRLSGLPSTTLAITRHSKVINGVSSDLIFSAAFRSYRNGKVEFEFKESSLDEYNSNWYEFTRQFYYPISNSQRLSFYDSLFELQLILQDELNRLNKQFNQVVYWTDFNGGLK
jgi:hypothetical protein